MVECGSGILRRLLWSGLVVWVSERGGLIVDWTTILALCVAVALVVYLAAALLIPEKFS